MTRLGGHCWLAMLILIGTQLQAETVCIVDPEGEGWRCGSPEEIALLRPGRAQRSDAARSMPPPMLIDPARLPRVEYEAVVAAGTLDDRRSTPAETGNSARPSAAAPTATASAPLSQPRQAQQRAPDWPTETQPNPARTAALVDAAPGSQPKGTGVAPAVDSSPQASAQPAVADARRQPATADDRTVVAAASADPVPTTAPVAIPDVVAAPDVVPAPNVAPSPALAAASGPGPSAAASPSAAATNPVAPDAAVATAKAQSTSTEPRVAPAEVNAPAPAPTPVPTAPTATAAPVPVSSAPPITTPSLPNLRQASPITHWGDREYTLQLLAARSNAGFAQFATEAGLTGADLFVIRLNQPEGDWWLLCSGRYPDLDSARRALAKLPPAARGKGAWPRRLGPLKKDSRT